MPLSIMSSAGMARQEPGTAGALGSLAGSFPVCDPARAGDISQPAGAVGQTLPGKGRAARHPHTGTGNGGVWEHRWLHTGNAGGVSRWGLEHPRSCPGCWMYLIVQDWKHPEGKPGRPGLRPCLGPCLGPCRDLL